MPKIRNISNDELIIGYGFPMPRRVKPDETIDVPDDALSAYIERVDGIPGEFDDDGVQKFTTVPSDLWVEVPDIKAAIAAPVEEKK